MLKVRGFALLLCFMTLLVSGLAQAGKPALYCGLWSPQSHQHYGDNGPQMFFNGGIVVDNRFNVEVAFDNGTAYPTSFDRVKFFENLKEDECVCLKGTVYRPSGSPVFDNVCGAYECNTHKKIIGNCK